MIKNKHILIIDDDIELLDLIAQFLRKNDFLVSQIDNIKDAKEYISIMNFDIIIIDIMLKDGNGIDLLKKIRKDNIDIPIIMLTAMSGSENRISGLENGANDYIEKPFEPRELVLRINNLIKVKKNDDQLYYFANFKFNKYNKKLYRDKQYIYLTESEANILSIFCKNIENIINREEIADILNIDVRTIDVQINRLRKKIEDDSKKPKIIKTIRNKGYILYSY